MSDFQPTDMLSLFLKNAEKASSGTHLLRENEKTADLVMQLISRDEAVYCPQSTKIEKAAVSGLSRVVEDYGLAKVTVEEVSAAIAETGSIVCDSGAGKAVQSSLLPLHHVAIVPREKIFSTLDDYFAGLTDSIPTNITLITGPSRTTDIELELEIGVHGPEKLDIIVI